jgi:glycosyltransferase involved in cell wall biosynthesis
MKILHVCESVIGGTGSYLSELVPHQVAKYGADNVALLIPKNQIEFLEKDIIEAGPRILTFMRPMRSLGSFFLLQKYLRTLMTFEPDIVHAHSSVAGAIVRLFRHPQNSRIVFCPHGWSMDMTGARYVRPIAEKVERWLARFPDKIVVISRHEYNRALELGLSPDKLKLIPNGIDKNIPSVKAAEWKDDRIRVLYAGRFDYQKGVDILLEAVQGIEEQVCVRLVGDFALSEIPFPTPLPDGVERLGWLDRDGVAAQMKSCDVLVVPSRWEGFGLVAVEAMRLSVPVLASAVGGLKEILADGKYGYTLPSEDPVALRNKLTSLKREELREVGANGYGRFLATYTSDRMVQQIDEIYAEITENHAYIGEIRGVEES